MKKAKLITGLLVTVLLTLALSLPAVAQVEPPVVEGELAPGGSMTLTKEVTTPPIPPNPDIYFLCDTTASMGPIIAAMQADAGAIMAAIVAAQPTAQFGVGAYQDFPIPESSPFCYENRQSIISDTTAVQAAIDGWTLCWGGDGPEGQFYALDRLAEGTGIGWRDIGTKIVVWFGDAPAHDPVPMAATGLGYDITETTVTNALVAAGIKVIAISWDSGYYAAGIDDDPNVAGGDYLAEYGTVEDGAAGQASRIATATGGVYLFAATPEEATAAVLEGIEQLTTDVWWEVEADPGLIVELEPAVHYDVPGDTMVEFEETITLTDDAPQCETLTATVLFIANEYPEEGAVIGEQLISIHVADITPPEVGCREWVNPHGKKVPPAGWTTEPGTNPNSGMNPDGFYQLGVWDNCDEDPMIFVSDLYGSVVFGPFPHETVVKITEDPDAAPECKKMGSSRGRAGAVAYHIILQTDAVIWGVDAYGNTSSVLCLVPPPPK